MKKLYLDIETAAAPDEVLERVMPEFEAPGNLKDPEKIAAAIAGKRAEWRDRAALKAITGRVIAYSFAVDSQPPQFAHFADETERLLLEVLVAEIDSAIGAGATIYTWNGAGFDLPFIMQRAAVHGIPAWKKFTVDFRGRRHFRENFIDARLVWAMYSPDYSGTSLDAVAKTLGVGEKNGSGKDFAALLLTDPTAAEGYAKNDITLLRAVVERMGI